MTINRCVIICSGSSIRPDFNIPIKELPIWNILKNEITIGINWSFHWLIPTIHFFGDYKFYDSQYEKIKNLPLLLTIKDAYYRREGHKPIIENLYFLKQCKGKKYLKYGDKQEGMHPYYWGKDAWKYGWYKNQLSSIVTINFAINGLEAKEIFILGMDACEINGHTHFYDDTNIGKYKIDNQTYYGVGKDKRGFYRTDNYNKIDELNNYWYAPLAKEWRNGVRIWNVSPQSAINVFPKISYQSFYTRLKNNRYDWNQEKIREDIKQLIKERQCG